MALTPSQIQSLLAKPQKQAKTNALVRTSAGVLERWQIKPSEFGKFVGKAGTKRRSRKGLVRTMPNGFVVYDPNWDMEVVAYTA